MGDSQPADRVFDIAGESCGGNTTKVKAYWNTRDAIRQIGDTHVSRRRELTRLHGCGELSESCRDRRLIPIQFIDACDQLNGPKYGAGCLSRAYYPTYERDSRGRIHVVTFFA